MRKLLRKQGIAPNEWVTDKCPAYAAALRDLGLGAAVHQGQVAKKMAERSHFPVRRRERKLQRFKSAAAAQRFLCSPGAARRGSRWRTSRRCSCRRWRRLLGQGRRRRPFRSAGLAGGRRRMGSSSRSAGRGACGSGRKINGAASLDHSSDHLRSTERRRARILVRVVHRAPGASCGNDHLPSLNADDQPPQTSRLEGRMTLGD
jgi:hypothetical protein